jgi:hypothetical protein
MQAEAIVKQDNRQTIAAFPRAAYTMERFAALFGKEVTWAYRLKYKGLLKVIPEAAHAVVRHHFGHTILRVKATDIMVSVTLSATAIMRLN